jgi:hypothetical protein
MIIMMSFPLRLLLQKEFISVLKYVSHDVSMRCKLLYKSRSVTAEDWTDVSRRSRYAPRLLYLVLTHDPINPTVYVSLPSTS